MSHPSKKTHKQYELELCEKEIDFVPLEEYKGANIKILHECFNGHKMLKAPSAVLRGHGCATCSGNKLKTTEQYIKDLEGRNISVLEQYINNATPILHECNICNTQWKAQPGVVKIKTGCPSCANSGFDKTKPAILYLFKYKNYYKLGISNRTLKARYVYDNINEFEIIFIKKYEIGAKAELMERKLKKRYNNLRVVVPGLLKSGGNTELFMLGVS